MSGAKRIYFDNSATTPLDPRVRAVIARLLDDAGGNPSSLHQEGRIARAAVEEARRHVAALVAARPAEVIFTSGGTEANNLAILGTVRPFLERGESAHVISSAIEHPSVLEPCRWLMRRGVEVTLLPVDSFGCIDPDDLARAIRPSTRLVSIMSANHVVGTLQPLRQLGEIARRHGVPFHTDAVQAAGKAPLDASRDAIDRLSISAHKIHGPQGVGALVVADASAMAPIIFGGGQESGLRSGTENVPAIAGFGEAARLCREGGREETARLVQCRERLIEGVLAAVRNAYLIGHRRHRLPGHACFGFAGQEGEAIRLMLALDEAGMAVSTGSACSAHRASEPSYVLKAMGFDAFRARGALRVTLGRFNTIDDVEKFLTVLPVAVEALRTISPRRGQLVGA